MNMDMSATFLAGSILVMMGFVVIIMGIVLINNIFHKYWKPVKIFWPTASPYEVEQKKNGPVILNESEKNGK
jgi:uncharacterized membrane protein